MRQLLLAACLCAALNGPSAASDVPYTPDGHLSIPENYRSWTFLTSSLDLNYDQPIPGASDEHSMLDNVFVNPSAYAQFVATGTWPDGTIFVKENRYAATAGTISKSGKFQTGIMSMELHVKDEKRFAGSWAFFVSDGHKPAQYVQPSASCYTCHARHGAVDTTFVQFYPPLLPIATAKGTLAPAYVSESAALAGPHQK